MIAQLIRAASMVMINHAATARIVADQQCTAWRCWAV
jgi:hypothetical protein